MVRLNNNYDLVVVGGGPGGYAAALKGASLGLRTALVEKDREGGTCLNWGCIPTKALHRSAEAAGIFRNADELGFRVSGVEMNEKQVWARKTEVVDKLVSGIEKLLASAKVDVFRGTGSFVDGSTLLVSGKDEGKLNGENFIVATGSSSSTIPVPGLELPGVVDSRGLLEAEKIPEHLAVIGGGVIGMEFASIFRELGSEVTVFEYMKNILPAADKDISTRLAAFAKKAGVKIHTGTGVKAIKNSGKHLEVYASGKKDIVCEADTVLLSVGRRPYVEGLNLEAAGVDFDASGIKTDEDFRTSAGNIFAVGDVNGRMMLAHAAEHQGMAAAEIIVSGKSHINHSLIPACVFTFPEAAYAGLTQQEAEEKYGSCLTGKFMFGANGKALSLGETDGFVKAVGDPEGNLVGIHILGPHASDLVHEGSLAIHAGLSYEELTGLVHAHPTLSEAFAEAVLDMKNEAIHLARRQRDGAAGRHA